MLQGGLLCVPYDTITQSRADQPWTPRVTPTGRGEFTGVKGLMWKWKALYRCKRATRKRKSLMQVKGPMKVKGPTEVKRPTEENSKHGGGQNNIRSLRSRTYPLLSHFQNDSATVECSTLVWRMIEAQCDAWFSALYKYSYLLTYLLTSPDPVSNVINWRGVDRRKGVGKR